MACRGIRFDTIAKIMPASLFSTQEIESSIKDLQGLPMDPIRSQRLQELADFAMGYDANPYPKKNLRHLAGAVSEPLPRKKEASSIQRDREIPAEAVI
jgi:hypothetical protein